MFTIRFACLAEYLAPHIERSCSKKRRTGCDSAVGWSCCWSFYCTQTELYSSPLSAGSIIAASVSADAAQLLGRWASSKFRGLAFFDLLG